MTAKIIEQNAGDSGTFPRGNKNRNKTHHFQHDLLACWRCR